LDWFTVGNSIDVLRGHAKWIDSDVEVPWASLKAAYSGIANYRLSSESKQYLRDRLLDCEPPQLWRLESPSVVVHRFPNNELRFFLLSENRHICEHAVNQRWYKYFSFIRELGGRFHLDIDHLPSIPVYTELAWMPQSRNYSHFLCDSFAPWIPFAGKHEILSQLSVLTIDEWPLWQAELIEKIGLRSTILGYRSFTTYILRPRAVWLPVLSNTLMAQLCLKSWLHKLSSNRQSKYSPQYNSSVFLTRNDNRALRIRNASQIGGLVSSIGGIVVDPSTLSFGEKINILGKASSIVCEGSGSLNAVLFSSQNSKVVMLFDPWAYSDPLMLDGGFPYVNLISQRLKVVLGESPKPLAGSPLASCEFSLTEIRQHIA
jgi:hypothetical protein